MPITLKKDKKREQMDNIVKMRKARKRNFLMERLRSISIPISKKPLIGLLLILIIAGLVYLGKEIVNLESFKVQNITVLSEIPQIQERFRNELFIGKNIIALRDGEVKRVLVENGVVESTARVHISKEMPDHLIIKVTPMLPVIVLVDYESVDYMDRVGAIIKSSTNSIAAPEFIEDTQDNFKKWVNITYPELKFDEIEEGEKKQMKTGFDQQRSAEIAIYFNDSKSAISQENTGNAPVIYFLGDSQKLKLTSKDIFFLKSIFELLKSVDIQFDSIYLKGNLDVEISLLGGKYLILNKRRSIEAVSRDIKSITLNGLWAEGTYFDLRSDVFSIK